MDIKEKLTTKNLIALEVITIIILSLLCINLYSNQVIGLLKQYKLWKLPENFTELYFTDHLNLPTTVSANQKRYFQFTIHNLENKTTTYNYEIYDNFDPTQETSESSQSAGGLQKILLDHGSVKLLNDDQLTIPVTFSLENPQKRNQIHVNLINQNQEIFFWVNGE